VTQNNDGSVNLADAERFLPAERHQSLYAGKTIPHRPNYGRAPEGKPALLRQIGNLRRWRHTATRDEAIRRQRSLWRLKKVSVRSAGLKDTGNSTTPSSCSPAITGIYGDTPEVERRLAYEESIRLPLLVRFPKAVKQYRTTAR
jgi:N-acetylglucosamine-6-sulfatase